MEFSFFNQVVVIRLNQLDNNKNLGFRISIWETQIIYSKISSEDKIHSQASSKITMTCLVEVVGSHNFNKIVSKEVLVEEEVMYLHRAALEEWVEVNHSVPRQSLKMDDKRQFLRKQE